MKISYLIVLSFAFLSVNAESLIIPLNLSEDECHCKMHTCERDCPEKLNVNGTIWSLNSCSSSWDVFPELGVGWEEEEDAHDCNIRCNYSPIENKLLKSRSRIKVKKSPIKIQARYKK